jgi:hypothetical protein
VTFLKKLGTILVKAAAIVTGFGPTLAAVIPGDKDDRIIRIVSRDLGQIADIVVQAEAMGQALGQPGAQKLIAATPMVAQIILQSSLLVGHKIAQPDLFKKGCASIASGTADVLNSLKNDVQTEEKT